MPARGSDLRHVRDTDRDGRVHAPDRDCLAGSGLSAAQIPAAPTDRADLSWARLAALGGLIPSVTRLGDELALVYSAAQITGSALAPLADWTWDGTRFAPPA
jgi:hypothetical protein